MSKMRTTPYLENEELAWLLETIARWAMGPLGPDWAIRDHAIFRIAAGHALRASDVGRLQISDVSVPGQNATLRIPRLSGTDGEFHPLGAEEINVLRVWLRLRGTAPGPLFPSRKKGGIKRRRLDQLMKKYCALASIPPEKAQFQALRNSCIRHFLEKTKDIRAVQRWAGHRDIASTVAHLP